MFTICYIYEIHVGRYFVDTPKGDITTCKTIVKSNFKDKGCVIATE